MNSCLCRDQTLSSRNANNSGEWAHILRSCDSYIMLCNCHMTCRMEVASQTRFVLEENRNLMSQYKAAQSTISDLRTKHYTKGGT